MAPESVLDPVSLYVRIARKEDRKSPALYLATGINGYLTRQVMGHLTLLDYGLNVYPKESAWPRCLPLDHRDGRVYLPNINASHAGRWRARRRSSGFTPFQAILHTQVSYPARERDTELPQPRPRCPFRDASAWSDCPALSMPIGKAHKLASRSSGTTTVSNRS